MAAMVPAWVRRIKPGGRHWWPNCCSSGHRIGHGCDVALCVRLLELELVLALELELAQALMAVAMVLLHRVQVPALLLMQAMLQTSQALVVTSLQ